MHLCLVCLQKKEKLKSTFVCIDCVDKSSAKTTDNLTGRDLIQALRTVGKPYQVEEVPAGEESYS